MRDLFGRKSNRLKPRFGGVRFALAVLLGICAPEVGYASDAYKMTSVTLLQPQEAVAQSVSSVQDLADYIGRVNAGVLAKLASYSPELPAGGSIFIAVRPGGKSNAWVATSSPLPSPLLESIVSDVKSIQPLTITGGTLVFAIEFSLWGGASPANGVSGFPEEWKTVVAKHGGKPVEITQLVDEVWPDAPAVTPSPSTPPSQ